MDMMDFMLGRASAGEGGGGGGLAFPGTCFINLPGNTTGAASIAATTKTGGWDTNYAESNQKIELSVTAQGAEDATAIDLVDLVSGKTVYTWRSGSGFNPGTGLYITPDVSPSDPETQEPYIRSGMIIYGANLRQE